VGASFSESVAPASVSGNFVLRDGNGSAVAASVSVSGSTASLQPGVSLSPAATYTATLTGGGSGVKDVAGNALAANYSWSFTTAAGPSCPCSLWASSVVPQTTAIADTTAFELGVRFTSDVAGYVTGIRFYKGTGNTGTHLGHLLSESGTLLAAATFTGESATGCRAKENPKPGGGGRAKAQGFTARCIIAADRGMKGGFFPACASHTV
jgi:hypothetical protein